MAIKIDLLPEYVKLKKDLIRISSACVVVIGCFYAGLSLAYEKDQLELRTIQTNDDTYKVLAAQAAQHNQAATDAQSQAAPMQNVIDFVYAASKTGPTRAAMISLVRSYIYDGALVGTIDMSDGKMVYIGAKVKNSDEYAKFLETLRRGADKNVLYGLPPSASGIAGFPAGTTQFISPSPDPSGREIVLDYPLNITAGGPLAHPEVLTMPDDPTKANGTTTPAAGGGS